MGQPTIRERLATLETEVKYLSETISKQTIEFKELREQLSAHLSESKQSLSGKEKASILIALITSIGAIMVALLK